MNVSVLLTDEAVEAGGWAETMELGRIGPAASRAVLAEVARFHATEGREALLDHLQGELQIPRRKADRIVTALFGEAR